MKLYKIFLFEVAFNKIYLYDSSENCVAISDLDDSIIPFIQCILDNLDSHYFFYKDDVCFIRKK